MTGEGRDCDRGVEGTVTGERKGRRQGKGGTVTGQGRAIGVVVSATVPRETPAGRPSIST